VAAPVPGAAGASDAVGMDTTLNPLPAWRTLLRPLTTARGYLVLTHHLVSFPLGLAYFVWFACGLSLGLGLAITLLGIPILTGVLATVRPLLALERGLAGSLLGMRFPAGPLAPAGRGIVRRLYAYWTDAPTWRGLAYLLVRFPASTAIFAVVVAAYGAALHLIAAPIVMPLAPIDLGFWEPDSVLDGFAVVPLGLVLLVAAGWISDGLGVLSREVARWGAR
jgi:hypothetical protein